MPRRSSVHPADIPSQSSNGNRGPRSFKIPNFHNPFPTMFSRQTAIHPDIPQLNIEIANRWIENPLIDPYNKKVVPLSIHPKSRYVFLYKKIMDALIKDIRDAFQQEGYILTIEDCKYIKNNLPIIHSIINVPGNIEYITYYHLFINPQEGYILTIRDCKYIRKILPIIQSKIKIPDPATNNIEYTTYYHLFIDPQKGYILTRRDCIYINTKMYIVHYEIDISGNEYIKYDHLFIKYFIKRTRKYNFDSSYCEDSEIKLYLNIYNAIKTKDPTIKKPYVGVILNKYKNMAWKAALSMNPFKKTAVNKSSKSQSFAKDNYVLIKDLLKNNMDLDKTDISIGKLVLNMCIDFKYILYMNKSMITLENYKIALHNQKTLKYVNYIYHMGFANGIIYNDIDNYYSNISSQNVEEIKFIYGQVIFNINKNKLYSNQSILSSFIIAYDTILSLYARFFNKQIDPSVLLIKPSKSSKSGSSKDDVIKLNKSSSSKDDVIKLNKSSSSKDDVIKLNKSSSSKDDVIKLNKSSSKNSKSSSKEEVIKLNPYCEKDVVDPITQHPIHELGFKDRKYVVSILSYNKNTKKVNYYCFNTIEIYNYILTCIQEIKDIKNPFFTNINFTDDDLDEICNKIKFLTNKPTYNSHVDIKEAIEKRLLWRMKELENNNSILEYQMEVLQLVIQNLQEFKAKKINLKAIINVVVERKLEAEKIINKELKILQKMQQKLEIKLEDEEKKLEKIIRKEILEAEEIPKRRNKRLERKLEELKVLEAEEIKLEAEEIKLESEEIKLEAEEIRLEIEKQNVQEIIKAGLEGTDVDKLKEIINKRIEEFKKKQQKLKDELKAVPIKLKAVSIKLKEIIRKKVLKCDVERLRELKEITRRKEELKAVSIKLEEIIRKEGLERYLEILQKMEEMYNSHNSHNSHNLEYIKYIVENDIENDIENKIENKIENDIENDIENKIENEIEQFRLKKYLEIFKELSKIKLDIKEKDLQNIEEQFRLKELQKDNTYNSYLQLSLGEGIKYEENSEEYKNNDIIGEYNYCITINLGNMRLPIINSILADNIFDNNVSYLENTENSFIIRLPIFKNVDRNNFILGEMQKIGKELGKLGEHDYKFPCRQNNKKIMDLPLFPFDMKENAINVFKRFEEYAEKHLKEKTSTI
jgi:hypothetical protein